jgi:hypothetical protein
MTERYLTLSNFEIILHSLCAESLTLQDLKDEQERLDWIKKEYLEKVERDYRDCWDTRKIRLRNVVHSGRLLEVCQKYFREPNQRKREWICCC